MLELLISLFVPGVGQLNQRIFLHKLAGQLFHENPEGPEFGTPQKVYENNIYFGGKSK